MITRQMPTKASNVSCWMELFLAMCIPVCSSIHLASPQNEGEHLLPVFIQSTKEEYFSFEVTRSNSDCYWGFEVHVFHSWQTLDHQHLKEILFFFFNDIYTSFQKNFCGKKLTKKVTFVSKWNDYVDTPFILDNFCNNDLCCCPVKRNLVKWSQRKGPQAEI